MRRSVLSGFRLDVDVMVAGALRGVVRMLAASHQLVKDHSPGAVVGEAQVHQALHVQVAVAGVPVQTVGLARAEGGR